MTTGAADARLGAGIGSQRASAIKQARAYFASDHVRTAQSVLGLIWLLDGALQFQSFMYSRGFIQLIQGLTGGQANWIADSVNWGADRLASNIDVWNTLFALVQCAIGIGLLYRRSVKPALLLSFGWSLVVWWFGEAFGMMFMASTGMGGAPMANMLSGAPGAVLLYGLIGAMVWPNGRPGGLLGVRGTRRTWAGLWIVMGYLWLTPPSTAPNGISNMIGVDSGMGWLSSLQTSIAGDAKGNGEWLAIILAIVTIAIGVAVMVNWRPKQFLWLAVGLNLIYWFVAQGLGGIFAGGATDPNAGPLFILMAFVLYTLVPSTTAASARPASSLGSQSEPVPA